MAGVVGNSNNSLSQQGLKEVGLPPIIFLFTLDQVAGMLNIQEQTLRQKYLYYRGRSSGRPQRHHMEAVNISPSDEKSDWRVSMKEFVKWCRKMGFRNYELTTGV